MADGNASPTFTTGPETKKPAIAGGLFLELGLGYPCSVVEMGGIEPPSKA